jgi:uncharacterized RDD family membrane protein YckC
LIAVGPGGAPTPDPIIRIDDMESGAPELWLDPIDRLRDDADDSSVGRDHSLGEPSVAPSCVDTTQDAALPLFNPHGPDDIPLISLPVAPRAPLAVRRTPPAPRLRAVPRLARGAEPALNFIGDPGEDETPAPLRAAQPAPPAEGAREVGGRRIAAAAIDHAILLAIDVSVVYFTLRIAGLERSDIGALPVAPLLTFLALLKLAYFTAFTAVGGQTIGKMALQVRVVGDNVEVDGVRALRRTCAAALSLLPLGLGFLPALVGDDRRALHDRLTHTRVIGLPSA